jgi:hypothetical protein
MKSYIGVLTLATLITVGCSESTKSLPVTLFKAMDTADTLRVDSPGAPEQFKDGDSFKQAVAIFSKHRTGWKKTSIQPDASMTELTVLKQNNTLMRFRLKENKLYYGDSEIFEKELTSDDLAVLNQIAHPS